MVNTHSSNSSLIPWPRIFQHYFLRFILTTNMILMKPCQKKKQINQPATVALVSCLLNCFEPEYTATFFFQPEYFKISIPHLGSNSRWFLNVPIEREYYTFALWTNRIIVLVAVQFNMVMPIDHFITAAIGVHNIFTTIRSSSTALVLMLF